MIFYEVANVNMMQGEIIAVVHLLYYYTTLCYIHSIKQVSSTLRISDASQTIKRLFLCQWKSDLCQWKISSYAGIPQMAPRVPPTDR